ncbi:hypothetical protein LQV05_003641 [Cryptococcus neoformans]|nr:hypothetical protein LQV05_003641 [Cryptococcus neoformans]
MWDYVFIRPKDSRTKESTSQAPSTASIASIRTLSNSNPWQHSAHPNNPNVSCLRSGFLAGRMCYGPKSTRESGTPSTQVAGMPELEKQDIDDRNVRSISGGPDLTASLQATVNDSSSDEDEEDENEVSEDLMRDVNNRIILVGADTIFEGYQNRNEIQLSCGYYFQRDTSEALRDMVSQSFGLYNLFRGITSVAIGETEAIVPHLDHNDSNGYSIIFQLSGVKGYTRVPQLGLDITHAVDDVIFLPTSQLVHFTSSRNTDSKRIMAQRMMTLSELAAMGAGGRGTNQGLAQYGAMLREKGVFACPVLYLARLNVLPNRAPSSQSSFPTFAERKDWYDLPLLSQVRDPTKLISYKTQQEAMINALLAAVVFSSKSTHENQRTGARLAEEEEVSIDAIARAGGWATATLETAYLSTLPRKSMRVIAGHPKKKGFFVLPRAVVPETLKDQVFPEIKKWYDDSCL